jgi:ribosomal protein S12 methylthiotransferase accessory factor
MLERERRCRLIDITSDIPISAFAAVTCERDGRDVAIGSAASPDPFHAAESALIEVLQMEISLDIARRFGASPAWNRWRQDISMATEPLRSIQPPAASASVARTAPDSLDACLAACAGSGVALLFLDMTRPELGMPVVRALSPELCPLKPRFGKERLMAHSGEPNPALLLV